MTRHPPLAHRRLQQRSRITRPRSALCKQPLSQPNIRPQNLHLPRQVLKKRRATIILANNQGNRTQPAEQPHPREPRGVHDPLFRPAALPDVHVRASGPARREERGAARFVCGVQTPQARALGGEQAGEFGCFVQAGDVDECDQGEG